jgi:hypothetical protein
MAAAFLPAPRMMAVRALVDSPNNNPPFRNTSAGAWKKSVLALVLFGVAFGYLEAAVVSYLRFLHEPVRLRFYPARPPGDLFPLLTREQAAAADPRQRRIFLIETGREAATVVMLAGVALAIAADLSQWAAAFVVAFGVWDLTFYLFLKVLLAWPASLFTWDILFIIPVPWASPVLAPVLVSAAMILCGIWHLRSGATGEPVHLALWNWIGIIAGAAIIIVSFTLDYRNVGAGGVPHAFNWAVFGLGALTGILGYAGATLKKSRIRALSAPRSRLQFPAESSEVQQ